MSAVDLLQRRMKYALARIVRPETIRHYQQLQKIQWLPPEELARHQNDRLAALLRHAIQHVPYYRDVLSNRKLISQDGHVDIEAFRQVPLLDKGVLRAFRDRFVSENANPKHYHPNTSGGSTGEPIWFIQDNQYDHWRHALKLLYDEWAGYHIGERKAVLWGSERDLFDGRERFRIRLERQLRNETWLNAFTMSDENVERYVAEINRLRPKMLLAYATSLYEMAQWILRQQVSVYSPPAIMTSAGTLLPHMRDSIEAAFGSRVYNRYGSREVGDIACQCSRLGGLHVPITIYYAEVLKPDGSTAPSGDTGEIVVTLLTNYSMPLIRYKIGDLGATSEERCPCGRGFPLLTSVSGRANSLIRTNSGTFDGTALSTLFYYQDTAKTKRFTSFSRYQIHQLDRTTVVMRVVVVNESAWNNERPALEDKFRLLFGQDTHFSILEVPEIPPAPSGKHAYVISDV